MKGYDQYINGYDKCMKGYDQYINGYDKHVKGYYKLAWISAVSSSR